MIFEKVKKVIAEQMQIDESSLTENTSFTEDLNADSLDLVSLVMALEDEYNMEIEEEEMFKIKTIGDVVNYIKSNS